jgi:hypothetical protein
MRVHCNALCVRRCQEAIPVAELLESVMKQHERVALSISSIRIPDIAIRVAEVLFCSLENIVSIESCRPEEKQQFESALR